jgi:hypothetical protein
MAGLPDSSVNVMHEPSLPSAARRNSGIPINVMTVCGS